MGASVPENALFNFKIDREKKEEMHILLVADYVRKGINLPLMGDIFSNYYRDLIRDIPSDGYNRGHFILYSKRLCGGDIYYKMTYQENGVDEILYEDTVDPEIFNRFVKDYEIAVLNPVGSLWQEIKPLEIRMNEVVQEKH